MAGRKQGGCVREREGVREGVLHEGLREIRRARRNAATSNAWACRHGFGLTEQRPAHKHCWWCAVPLCCAVWSLQCCPICHKDVALNKDSNTPPPTTTAA